MAYLDSILHKAKTEAQRGDTIPDAIPVKNVEDFKKKTLVDSYGDVRIYRKLDEPLMLYEIPSPRYQGEEKSLIEGLMEIALNVITVDARALTEDEKREKYFQKILDVIDQTPELKVPVNAKEFYARAVVREMVGYGLIDPLTRDDQLEEIMIIGADRPVYVYHRKYEMLKTNLMFYQDQDIRDLADRIARAVNRRIDLQVPILDARLSDGTRVNATIPPISLDGTTVTLRKFKKDPLTVVDLMSYGTLPSDVAAFLWMACDGMGAYPANVLIAGGTASGKTTLLNMLC
ncbi:MAG TPA: ATPase, T2SS/T4P/T4SS family, partial [Candidatus Norongarragalinales archaeon]|nr:ATPase, T2SS/T4P/T4SS family [Candidatus Norongarragalinales archaeon]